SNFIPGGGIWMNTQRPEWNDANNALVGFGISVVTLGYIARYLRFMVKTFGDQFSTDTLELSGEVAALLQAQLEVFGIEPKTCLAHERKEMMDRLGKTASAYRQGLYNGGLSGEKTPVSGATILSFLTQALSHTEATLRENKRPDALWHSYNLLRFVPAGVEVDNLKIMLEGQVSILSSELLDLDETLELLANLRESPLYRPDQDSYVLYPDRHMPGFLEKNSVPRQDAESIPLLKAMLAAGDTRVVTQLPSGNVAFNGNLHNCKDLEKVLTRTCEIQKSEAEPVLQLFEETFNHRAFTGRSGTFFAYEGLGSIYWHMVSKLVLAVQEAHIRFGTTGSAEKLSRLADWYRKFRNGLGVDKNPSHYGAFPTDAYSHTPAHCGAQQPGMTGQVKEDILIRLAELGISIEQGRICIRPQLLEVDEFLQEPTTYSIPAIGGGTTTLQLEPGTLAFSYCQVPIIYRKGAKTNAITVYRAGQAPIEQSGLELPEAISREIFQRTGHVTRIEVDLVD
ncbi:MAG TPA: hypothetical protein VK995_06880, partial [Oceanipulchritudo sp.]|nr:hypothetical protein [Oceanipulchritudo sp.]